MKNIDPIIFADLAAKLDAAEAALGMSEELWRNATNDRAKVQILRDQARARLRAYVEACAGNKIALLP